MTLPPDTTPRWHRLLPAGLLLALSIVASPSAGALACPTFGAKQTLSTYWKGGLREVSGIQSSLEHPGVLWAIQDSGNGPHLYALDTGGHILDTITLKGANVQNVDWEAIALDPRKNARDLLYIGDIGDNAHNRNGTSRQVPALYRLREPNVSANWTGRTHWFSISSGIEKFPFRYYTGDLQWKLPPRDAEAMFVDPLTHKVVIIQKDLSSVSGVPKLARVFSISDTALKLGVLNKAQSIGEVVGAGPGVTVGPTAADISTDGRWIVIKNYQEGFLWHRGWNEGVATTFANAPLAPCRAPVDNSEAITFQYARGAWTGFLSMPESRRTGTPPLDRFPKK